MNDSLGDRMKRHEQSSRFFLTNKVPVIIRVDGKAFHTLTKGLEAFDVILARRMFDAAKKTAAEMQGFKIGYIQSDEVTFLLSDLDSIEAQSWFDNNVQKLASISASYMSVYFTKSYYNNIAVFDSRAFNVPKEDVINNFLWRAKDNERNSLQNYARMFFSHKELMNKKRADIHEMLHGIGKNWATDLVNWEKNGTFFTSGIANYNVEPTYDSIKNLFLEWNIFPND